MNTNSETSFVGYAVIYDGRVDVVVDGFDQAVEAAESIAETKAREIIDDASIVTLMEGLKLIEEGEGFFQSWVAYDQVHGAGTLDLCHVYTRPAGWISAAQRRKKHVCTVNVQRVDVELFNNVLVTKSSESTGESDDGDDDDRTYNEGDDE